MPRSAPNQARRRPARPTFLHDDAVSEVIGNILLVAITVLMVAGLSAVVLSQPGPAPKTYADLAVSLEQGSGDWGTGDEVIRIEHRGGEAFQSDETTISLTVGTTNTRLTGADLDGPFADGFFRIGEVWTRTTNIPNGQAVNVDVITTDAGGSSIASTNLLTAACGSDTAAPTVQAWTQVPPDVQTTTTGPVAITAVAADGCAGVDQTATPNLYYRLNDGSNPPYTNAGAMTLTAVSTWQGSIPDPTWSAQSAKTLQYYVEPLEDLQGNSGPSSTQSDLVQPDCSGDVTPPTVQTWTQAPPDVTTATIGSVSVTALLTDTCAGVDNDADPELHFRINDGSNPAFTNAGPMTPTVTDTWQATIPDQTWSGQDGNSLEYELRLMTDLNANVGTSTRQTDLIQSSCAGDTNAPTVQTWTQNPPDVTSATGGGVTITAVLTDDCAGVDNDADPELHHRVNDGSDPAFTNGGAMTLTGANTWQKAIPDQGWGTQGGKTLEYELRLMTDLNANAGTSTRQSDLVEAVTLYTYVNSNTPTTGTVSNFANAQSASDGDAVANLAEADTGSSPTTTTLGPSTYASSSAFEPENVLLSDDQRAYLLANGAWVEGAGFTAPGGATTVSSVVVGFEGAKFAENTVTHEQTVTTTGSGGTTVVSPTITSAAGHVYLAAVVNGENNIRTVTGVSGLGLTWARVDGQSGSEGNGRTEVWVGTGTPTGDGAVTATFSGTVDLKILVISRYSGADPTSPVEAFNKAEAAGSGTSAWSVAAIAGTTNGRLYVAVNVQDRDDVAFTNPTSQRADLSSGGKIRLGVADGAAAASNAASGTIPQGNADWQAIALTLRPGTTQVRLVYSVAGVQGATTSTVAPTTTDTLYTVTVTGDRAWTVADIAQLAVRVEGTSLVGNFPSIDRVYVTVTTSPATFALNVQADFAGVPSGSTQVLELRYRTTGDTFNVQVWDGASYRTCTGTLNSATLATYTCTLALPAEYQSGSPRIRFTDVTPTSTTQGNLFLEYVRVKTN